jgi:hypothetical protein
VRDLRQLGYIRSILRVRADAGEFWPKEENSEARESKKPNGGVPKDLLLL